MHIVFVITRSDTVGGAQIHVRDLALSLIRAGHKATVLTGGEGRYAEILREAGVPHHSLRHLVRPIRPWRDARAVAEIHSILKALKPDLLSTHSSKAGWIGRIAARMLGIPVIFTAHGWSFADGVSPLRSQVYRLAERAAAPLADRIIVVADADRALALRYGIGSEEQVVTVHNGMPDLDAQWRSDPAREPPRLIMTARLDEPKDHPTLFRALAGLRDLPWSLDLVGDGPLTESRRQMATELGIADRVRFLGLRSDVAALLRDSQLFLLITRWEGLPRSILEAMRSGLPVVASHVGGVAEVVIDGSTGFLINREDSGTLADRLRVLLTDPELRGRMGKAGRQHFENHFTFERMMRETVEIYRSTIASRADVRADDVAVGPANV